jgi:hypothetical protein
MNGIFIRANDNTPKFGSEIKFFVPNCYGTVPIVSGDISKGEEFEGYRFKVRIQRSPEWDKTDVSRIILTCTPVTY